MPGADKNKNCHLICNAFSLVPPSSATVVADTGCTSHCFKPDTPYDNKQPMCDGLRVGLPNGTSIKVTHTVLLPAYGPLPPLSTNSWRVSLFPWYHHQSPNLHRQFCDDGYSAVFTSHTFRLVKDDASTVVGHRNRSNGLWDIDLTASTPLSNPTFTQAHVNSAYKMKTLVDLVLYLYRACFSPVVYTWTNAINDSYLLLVLALLQPS